MKEQKTFGIKTLFTSVFIASLLAFSIGSQSSGVLPWSTGNTQAGGRYEDANLQPFFKAWKLLDENFAPGTTTTSTGTNEDRVWGAIQGLASSYGDPYTTFFPPEEKKIFDSQVQGDFEGVGMEIGIKNGFLTVISPLKGSPAERAGIQSGDVVLKIDGKDSTGISVEDAVSVIRGKGGTAVTLLIGREGTLPFDVEIIRETIALPTIETTNRPDGVFVIRLFTFNANAAEKFRGAIREFANSGSDKLVIDLRGNPGGYLEVAVDIASWFLPVGKVIVTEDYGEKRAPDVSRSRGYDVFNDSLKLVVLIDQGSASASEILAGALRDHGKATLIGSKSFGKGSVQQLFNVTSDTSLKITIARWLTPNGLSISHEGITPDIVLEMTKEDRETEKDPQLERAAEFLLKGK